MARVPDATVAGPITAWFARTRTSLVWSRCSRSALAPAVLARDNSWTLTRTPPSVIDGQPTTIAFLATNASDGGGGGEIGCIEIVVPSTFSWAP